MFIRLSNAIINTDHVLTVVVSDDGKIATINFCNGSVKKIENEPLDNLEENVKFLADIFNGK